MAVKIVEITWRDHTTVHGWASNVAEVATVTTVGYLHSETKEFYVVLTGWNADLSDDDEERFDCSHAILKSTVKEFTVVRDDPPST